MHFSRHHPDEAPNDPIQRNEVNIEVENDDDRMGRESEEEDEVQNLSAMIAQLEKEVLEHHQRKRNRDTGPDAASNFYLFDLW